MAKYPRNPDEVARLINDQFTDDNIMLTTRNLLDNWNWDGPEEPHLIDSYLFDELYRQYGIGLTFMRSGNQGVISLGYDGSSDVVATLPLTQIPNEDGQATKTFLMADDSSPTFEAAVQAITAGIMNALNQNQ
jgi:hypothetical protein